MPGPMYEIIGHEMLMHKLNQLGALTNNEELEALLEGGNIIRDKARDNITSQGLVDTGELRDSLTVEKHTTAKEVVAGTSLGYRAWIHETGGTIFARKRRYLVIKTGSGFRKVRSVYIPQRAFLRPAVEETKDAVAQAIQDKLWKTLRARAGI